jgi:hypothetical protein
MVCSHVDILTESGILQRYSSSALSRTLGSRQCPRERYALR